VNDSDALGADASMREAGVYKEWPGWLNPKLHN